MCRCSVSGQYLAVRDITSAEFARFPDSDHMFRKAGHPTLILEYYRLLFDWLERYVGVGTG